MSLTSLNGPPRKQADIFMKPLWCVTIRNGTGCVRLISGKDITFQPSFHTRLQPEGNIRNIATWGGGPVWDIGCYCVLASIRVFGSTPRLLTASVTPEAHLDVEKSATALLEFRPARQLLSACQVGQACLSWSGLSVQKGGHN